MKPAPTLLPPKCCEAERHDWRELHRRLCGKPLCRRCYFRRQDKLTNSGDRGA